MSPDPGPFFRLAAGVDVVPLEGESFLFRSATLAVKAEGPGTQLLVRQVLPLLDGVRTLAQVTTTIPDLQTAALLPRLEDLARAGVLERSDRPYASPPEAVEPAQIEGPFRAFITSLGLDPREAAGRLSGLRVAVFGLEAHGAHLALQLAHLGIGELLVVDPFPIEPADRILMPPIGPVPTTSRQEAVQTLISAQPLPSRVRTPGAVELSREVVSELARECDVLFGCFDRGFEAAQHWINRASIEQSKVAFYAELGAHVARVGPGVLPGETPCYMCYRMRTVACEENFEEAMAYERYVNERKRPSLATRPVLPTLPIWATSVLAGELVRVVALGQPSALAGRVHQFEGLSVETTWHPVLRHPQCPVCGQKKKARHRDNIPRDQLPAAEVTDPRGDLNQIGPMLVSRHCGVVRRCEPFGKDPVEPARPYIVRADVADSRLSARTHQPADVCSGKGMDMGTARLTALGEAVERYSSGIFDADEVIYERRTALPGPTLDPTALVLYHESQYSTLPYAPYRDNVLGWVPARSLVSDQEVLVPALAVFMSYQARTDDEFLFPITSNGLAAGPTMLEAVLRAVIEVLERDAFLVGWLNRLPMRRVSPRGIPDADVAELCELYRRRSVELRLYQCPTDHPCTVFAGVALEASDAGGPAAVFGLGAHPDPVLAARKAILEVCQVRPALRRRLRDTKARKRLRELVEDPTRVATIDDHDLLYASREALPALGFMLDQLEERIHWEPPQETRSRDWLDLLVNHFSRQELDLLYVNLSPADMAGLGLYTARALVPGFQPVDFGWKERRLGGKRLYSLPVKLGFASTVAAFDDLNHDPHPLA